MKTFFHLSIIVSTLLVLQPLSLYAQGCCSGGSSSPIASGEAIGVLKVNEIDISTNFQYYQSNKFYSGTQDTLALFDNFITEYLFLKADYGLTEYLTLSVSSGYYLNKNLYEVNDSVPLNSSGLADLIILPKYSVWNKSIDGIKSELTVGVGIKIPLGSFTDSTDVFTNTVTNQVYYAQLPPSLQATNGSTDIIFSSFFYKNSEESKVKIFASTMYIKKGWNSQGEKFGDYMSLGLFASRELTSSFNVSLQLKGEKVNSIQAADGVDLLAQYSVDIEQTGSKKLFIVPQISFNRDRFSFFANTEIPLYQNMTGIQLGSQYSITSGLSYRFSANKTKEAELILDQ